MSYISLLPVSERNDDGIFVSVHLNSNRPVQIVRFLEAIEHNADHPEKVEVIINIDKGDEAMLAVLRAQQSVLTLRLRWIETDLIHSFADTWKPYNLILPMTDPNAYFVILLSDEMLLEEKGWDTLLRPYIGYFPDHIFRLRASVYRWRNYTDFWECGFAPDSVCFYTRDWLMIQGEWNPCNGPDSFQQCVSYYLSTSEPFSQTQYHRDLVLPFLRVSGEGVSVGMDPEAARRRFRIATRMWFILVSHRYQQVARRHAMMLKAHILARAALLRSPDATIRLRDNAFRKQYVLETPGGLEVWSYGLSWVKTTITNLLRMPFYHYYGGGGARSLRGGHILMGIHFVLDAYWTAYGPFCARKDEIMLRYYRWRNTKLNHLAGHLQRFPRLHALARSIFRRMQA